ncbi:hypothetical protein F5887DRAFT_1069938 [Amanita rubescens]|nr:hypothetical protein F5887DRAFT_1069938 [Amanita rubescens]
MYLVFNEAQDSFMNLAKQGYEAYTESQSNVRKTGGQEYNSPHHSGQSGQPQQQQQWNYGGDVNHDDVVRHAEQHGGSEHGDHFSNAMGYLNDNQSNAFKADLAQQHAHNEPVDDQHVLNAHQQAYQNNDAGGMSAGNLGAAAAMQALKNFTSGGGASSGGGGSNHSQLISMAMAEAAKMFDKSGGTASGNKQDAVNGAAMTVMKLLVQSKFSGGTTGGSDSGGLGSLMGLASKFM